MAQDMSDYVYTHIMSHTTTKHLSLRLQCCERGFLPLLSTYAFHSNPTKQHASLLHCPKQPLWALLLLQLKQCFNFIYYIGLKLVCDVKDGFLWETYIAGSAIFSVRFLLTFSEIKVAIGVLLRYLQCYYYTISLLSLYRSHYIWLYYVIWVYVYLLL